MLLGEHGRFAGLFRNSLITILPCPDTFKQSNSPAMVMAIKRLAVFLADIDIVQNIEQSTLKLLKMVLKAA
jgi:hypothetical protein